MLSSVYSTLEMGLAICSNIVCMLFPLLHCHIVVIFHKNTLFLYIAYCDKGNEKIGGSQK